MKRYNHEQIATAIRNGELDAHLEDFIREAHSRQKQIDLNERSARFAESLRKWDEAKNRPHKRVFSAGIMGESD